MSKKSSSETKNCLRAHDSERSGRSEIGALVALMMPKIWVLAKKYGRLHHAEDVAQEVAEKLLKMDAAWLARRHKGWLPAVVRSVAVNAYRRAKIEARYLDRSVGLDVSGAVCEGVGEDKNLYVPAAPTAEEMEDYLVPTVREALSQLSDEHRKVLVLYSAGFSYETIAAYTGVKKGTVKSRLYYARKEAQRLLK